MADRSIRTHITAGIRIGIGVITLLAYAWQAHHTGALSWLCGAELLALGALYLGLCAWTHPALLEQGLSERAAAWVSLAIGVSLLWDPASLWASTSTSPEIVAALLWGALLGLIDHIEEIRSQARSGSGALLRGTGDSGPTENLTVVSYWGVSILVAASLWVLPESILLMPGLVAGLKRRSAWGSVAWRLFLLVAIPVLLLPTEIRLSLLERYRQIFRLWTVPGSNDIQAFFPPGESVHVLLNGLERAFFLLIFFFLAFHIGREILGMIRAFRTTPESVAWDRPGTRQNQFLAATSAFLLIFSLAKSENSAFGHLLIWPAVALTLSRLSSLRMPRWTSLLSGLTCAFAVISGALFFANLLSKIF